MELREILEALDTAAKEKDGTAIIPRNLAEDARDALQMLAAGMDRREAGHTVWKTVGEPGEFRYSAEEYGAAMLALDAIRKKVEDPEDKARMRLLLEAVGEKAEREYPAYFRAVR